MRDRANFLLIVADQLAAAFLAPYGGPAKAPHIDRLASEGLVFDAMYSNSPLCAPARFAMMSGQLNSRIGAYDNASELPASVPTFAHHLRADGYQTSLVGKMHFVGPDQLHGFEDRLTTDIYPADFGWTPNWADPEGRFNRWFHNMDSVVGAGIAETSNQLDYDDEVSHRAVRKLRDLARSDDERPWLLTVSFTHPHDPYVARREDWDRYDETDVPPPVVALRDVDADPHSRRLRRLMAGDQTSVTDSQIQAARRAYLANVSYIDDQVGRLMETIRRLDLASDTIIVFTADHGDMLGERGLWYKMSYFEHSSRVPLIVHGAPGVTPTRVATPTSLLDIGPTLFDLAGMEQPPGLDGESVMTYVDRVADDRTVLGEYMGEGAIAPIFMVRRADMKFVWSAPDPPQLFDLAQDPRELVNLAARSDHRAEVDSLVGEVHERWAVERIDAEVRSSQRDRTLIAGALRRGRYTPWDFEPPSNGAEAYMRNHLDLNEVEAGRRL